MELGKTLVSSIYLRWYLDALYLCIIVFLNFSREKGKVRAECSASVLHANYHINGYAYGT